MGGDFSNINSVFKGNVVSKASESAEQCWDLNIVQNTKKPGKDQAGLQESLAD